MIVKVGAGAKWKEVIKELNKQALSPLVTQSDYDFAIGGAISTNVHGWQAKSPPIIATIKSFNLVKADGSEVHCENEGKNQDIFKAAIGGYGLLGVITEINLKVTKNKTYKTNSMNIKMDEFVKTFDEKVLNNQKTEMFFCKI